MPEPDEILEARLLAIFKVEARELIQAMAGALGGMEKNPAPAERAKFNEAIFRSAHSLKGAARAVNVKEIESLCHAVESVFMEIKKRGVAPSQTLFDLLYKVLAGLDGLLRRLDATGPEVESPPTSGLVHELNLALKTLQTSGSGFQPEVPATGKMPVPLQSGSGFQPELLAPCEIPMQPHGKSLASLSSPSSLLEAAPPSRPPVPLLHTNSSTVRVAASKLDAMLLQAAELIPPSMAAFQHAGRLRELGEGFAEWKKSWLRIRPAIRSLNQILNTTGDRPEDRHVSRLLEFVEGNQQFAEQMDRQVAEISRTAEHDHRTLASLVDELLERAAEVAMQPFSTVLDLFPRFVRETSREQNKEIDLVIHGAGLEIDRRILEEMKDPLIHLIRNCIDHGIETPETRAKAGKPTRGTITIRVSAQEGAAVELRVSDDGAGIDIARLKAAVIKDGLLSADDAAALPDEDALQLVFQSGATTSPIITDLSGRGLGLAIAREKVSNLNGEISVDSQPGRGVDFRIVLPLTLARFRGVLVKAGESLFMLPTAGIDQVIRMREDAVKTVENREAITVSEQTLALVRLVDLLSLPPESGHEAKSTHLAAVLLSSNGSRIALAVDAVLGEQEILVKPLGPQLAGLRDFAGATVLGDGAVIPILSIPEMMKRARQAGATPSRRQAPSGAFAKEAAKSVLVVEDSITSRSLLKSILETAGYKVETAVDGIDAFTKLRSSHFDLVVSDVDMPRMNGFGLTAKIRADKSLAELPVVLVTSLDSATDREHGIDVGANAYIIKSTFDQTNLIEVVRQLL